MSDNPKTVQIGGFETIITTRDGLASLMVSDCKNRAPSSLPKLVFSSNGQGVSLARSDAKFAQIMRSADIIHADGMSVVVASRLLTKNPLPERISTTDFFHNAARAAVDSGLRFFILGGAEAQNARAVEKMLELYPQLQIVGRRNGYFSRDQDEQVCREILESGADVLWVGMGKPLQEFWSVDNRSSLVGLGWIKTCGGLYGYLAGDEKRSPKWIQSIGFEWFYRAMQSPTRLGWRYLVTNPHALWCMIKLTAKQ